MRPPDPLTDGVATLRPWTARDAPVLAAAWSDEDILRRCAVPDRPDLARAEAWIDGCGARAEAGTALDLAVLDDTGTVVGEVGLAPIDWPNRRAAIGYWTAAAHRRRGWARRAVTLLGTWALGRPDLDLLAAETAADDQASAGVLTACGYERVARRGDRVGWILRDG